LANTTSVVALDELNVAGLLKHHHLAQAIADVGFYEFKRQLRSKTAWYSARVLLSDRWEPSSTTCSGCGWVDAEPRLSDRTFCCRTPDRPECGLVLDRDLNVARNLASSPSSSRWRSWPGVPRTTRNACGGKSAGQGQAVLGHRSLGKQE